MGTRSLTRVHEVYGDSDEILVNMYRQFDGYPEGHGQDLVEFMDDRTIGNGIPCGQDLGKFSNGAGCLAAQMVANFKRNDEPGGFYLYPVNAMDCGQEYEYDIFVDESLKVRITVNDTNSIIFDGSVEEFKSYCLDPYTDDD